MTQQRRRRLERLEANQPKEYVPPPDISGWISAVMAACQARENDPPFSMWPPRGDDKLPPKWSNEVMHMVIKAMERMAERMRESEGFAEAEAERERRLAANLRAIEREQAAREAA